MVTHDHLRLQLNKQRRKVDFDSYDITVEDLVRRVYKGRIEYAPVYQRQFRWDDRRKADLIESLLLGIPIPPLFMATNIDVNSGNQWEVVDGIQRLLTLVQFIELDEYPGIEFKEHVGIDKERFSLRDLKYLTTFEGKRFSEFPNDIKTSLLDRPLKVTVLNDKSDKKVRYDLFERLNTGGIALTHHEVRECVFMGKFTDILRSLSEQSNFKKVVKLQASRQNDGTAREYVLRYFAFRDKYLEFDHSVKDFLTEYMSVRSNQDQFKDDIDEFNRTFNYLSTVFPNGLRSRRSVTGVNLFEGVAVGASLALKSKPNLKVPSSIDWVLDQEMIKMTTGATNDKRRVKGRIDLGRKHFLEGH